MDSRRPQAFNVLHVITRLPVGGVENMLLKVVKGYDLSRFRPMVCCIKEGGALAEELASSGYRVTVLNRMQGHGFDRGAVTALYKLLKEGQIHVLRTHQYHANLYGRIAGILAGIPVIISSFHNVYRSPHMPKIHRRFINHILGLRTDRLVAVSQAVAADIIRYDKVDAAKVKVIHNGIAPEIFHPGIGKDEAREELGLPRGSLIIGTVGRLNEQKGHRFLIEAAAGLEGASVAIAGDGPLRKELEGMAKRLNVRCIFMGTVDPTRIVTFYRALDLFCFPSLWEGFGGALMEAMATGLPIVASDIPPHREVLDGAGIFVSAGDSLELRKALQQVLGDEPMRNELCRKSKKEAERFTIENTVRAYEDLFTVVLKEKHLL